MSTVRGGTRAMHVEKRRRRSGGSRERLDPIAQRRRDKGGFSASGIEAVDGVGDRAEAHRGEVQMHAL
jgi:hypothetical protein